MYSFSKNFASLPSEVRSLFIAVATFFFFDAFFMVMSLAWAYQQFSFKGSLVFTAALYLLSSAGFFAAFKIMQSKKTTTPWNGLLGGLFAGSFLTLIASFVADPYLKFMLFVFAGTARGVSWGCRHWLEFFHTKGAHREKYLSYLQALGIFFKISVAGLSAIVLYYNSDLSQFIISSLAALCLITVLVLMRSVPCPLSQSVGALNFKETLKQKTYWDIAPFYVFEGVGNTLRHVLYITGVLTVVASLKSFMSLDLITSVSAIFVMLWVAHRATNNPSIKRLKLSLTVLGFSWIFLLTSLWFPIFVVAFVVLNGLSSPLVIALKNSLVLKGLGSSGEPQDNMLARETTAIISRMSAMAISLTLVSLVPTKELGLIMVVAFMILIMPAEYYYAKKIMR